MTDDTLHFVDLASERLGAAVLATSDDFFAPKERLILPSEPVWIPDKYVPTGKWMDGWESRRRRTPGHDWCIVRLGARGRIDHLVVDTTHFRGNYPAQCAAFVVDAPPHASVEDLQAMQWRPLLPKSDLTGNSKNPFRIEDVGLSSHVRLSIYPDGGVARLRVMGRAVPDWDPVDASAELCDLAGARTGGRILGASDMFFGHPVNLLMPDRGLDMSDGWETKRRRGPGHDWVVIELGTRGRVLRAEVDTLHFKGNAPGSCDIEVCDKANAPLSAIDESDWRPLLRGGILGSHALHRFEAELTPRQWATHARLRIHPDGGVSRLRLWGRTERGETVLHRLGAFNYSTNEDAEALLRKCCAAPSWAQSVAAARPFSCLAELFAVADEAWRTSKAEWPTAFAAHPRIGDKAEGWTANEQSGVQRADDKIKASLISANKSYEEKFGHVFLICATGKSAEEMLAAATARLDNDPATELANAAEQQRQITHLRLFKGLLQ